MSEFRIVRRAFSEYTDVAIHTGTYLSAELAAMAMQHVAQDGEYLVRSIGQANWQPGSSYQSGMDWL